jgi:hypothetical protein
VSELPKNDEEEAAGRGESEDPTAVEGPMAEDETSPEGIPSDAEATAVEDGVEVDAPAVAVASAAVAPHEPPPQVRLIHRPPELLMWRALRIAAAFVLAGAAFGVHMWLNVPEVRVVEKPKEPPKPKKGPERGGRAERMPERSQAELDEAWSRWSGEPFEEEPTRGRWSRDAQSMMNKAVVVARKAAFAGAPEDPRVIVTGTECHTIRCRFVLRSPFEHEVDMLAKTLERVTYDGEPMFREVVAETVEPPTPQSPKEDFYRQITVGVQRDGYEPTLIAIPDAEAEPENEPPSE